MKPRPVHWIAISVAALLALSGCVTDWRTRGPVTVTDVILAPSGNAGFAVRDSEAVGGPNTMSLGKSLGKSRGKSDSGTPLKTFTVAAGVAGDISVYFTSSIDYGTCQVTLDGRRTAGRTVGTELPSGGRGFRIDIPTAALGLGRTAQGLLSCETGTGMNPPEVSQFTVKTAAMPVLRAQPRQITFPATTVGQSSDPVAVTVTNRGLGSLRIHSINFESILGWDMTTTEFRALNNTCADVSLAQGQSCTVDVVHAPTTQGEISAFMVFDSNAPNPDPGRYPLYTSVIVLEGNAPRTTVLSVSPAAKDFGEVMVGAGLEDTFVATNISGGSLLVLCMLDADEAQYRVLNGACHDVVELAPGASLRVDIQFTPSATGVQSGTLRFLPGSETAAEVRVPLTGTGFTHTPPP